MTNEQLDEARAKEAWRNMGGSDIDQADRLAVMAARLARENWTPPEPVVDPDVLAFREWLTTSPLTPRPSGDPNRYDDVLFETYLAGARMAREQEQERAKVLVEFAKGRVPLTDAADVALAKYWGEA